jgi:ankyrin repeat protein
MTTSSANSPLLIAIEQLNVTDVSSLISTGIDVGPAMQFAAAHANAAIMTQLLDAGGDVMSTNCNGDSLCHIAIRHNADPAVLGALLQRAAARAPALLQLTNLVHDSICHEAAKSSNVQFIEQVLAVQNDVAPNTRALRSPLHSCAAHSDSTDVAKRLIAHGFDIDALDESGSTPLLLAVKRGSATVVRALMAAGARLDVVDKQKRSPVYYAAQRSSQRVLEMLLEAGADASVVDHVGRSVLHIAAANTNEAPLALLLAKAAGTLDINAADSSGLTPCHVAAGNANERLVELLVGAGCRLDAQDTSNATPCHLAAMNSNEAVIAALVAAGAGVSDVDSILATPALRAASNSNEKVMQVLVECAADLNSRDRFGRAPCHRAAANANERVMATLVACESVDLCVKDKYGMTVWLVAIANVNLCVLWQLLSTRAMACFHETNSIEWSSVHQATSLKNEKALEILLYAGADVDTRKAGVAPLHLAADSGGDIGMATLLIAGGSEIDIRNIVNDCTPCHLAAMDRNRDMITLLVAAGADLAACDNTGTPVRVYIDIYHMREPNEEELRDARQRIVVAQTRLVRWRALQVCVGLQPLALDALQLCEVLKFACGPVAATIPFHKFWKLATTVKHFRKDQRI